MIVLAYGAGNALLGIRKSQGLGIDAVQRSVGNEVGWCYNKGGGDDMEIDENGGRIFDDMELEELMKGKNLIRLRVGDRVRVTNGPHRGEMGTIIGFQGQGKGDASN